MFRLLRYALVFLLAVAAFLWLQAHDGRVTFQWLGWQVEMQMLFALPALLALFVLLWVVEHGVRWVFALPDKWTRGHVERKRRKGYGAMLDGFTAIAAADASTARAMAKRAEKLLQQEDEQVLPVVLMLAAQAEQLHGNQAAAEEYYQAMLAHSSSEFLGLRGLLTNALRALPPGEHAPKQLHEATMLAERAYELKPETPWVVTTVLELHTREGRWRDAEKIIRRAQKKHVFDAIEASRLLAIVHYQQAMYCVEKQDDAQGVEHVQRAHKERVAFTPATDLLCVILDRQGARDKALRLLEKSWGHQPHPDLFKRHQQLTQAETPERRLKLTERLVKALPEHWESQMALAETALDAGHFSKAQNHLKAALSQRETIRLCRLMVRYEDEAFASGHAEKSLAEEWRFRMMDAQADARWGCDACQFMPTQWHANCTECGAFDHIHWHEPMVIQAGDSSEPGLLERSHMLRLPS
jgi:HemY protein